MSNVIPFPQKPATKPADAQSQTGGAQLINHPAKDKTESRDTQDVDVSAMLTAGTEGLSTAGKSMFLDGVLKLMVDVIDPLREEGMRQLREHCLKIDADSVKD